MFQPFVKPQTVFQTVLAMLGSIAILLLQSWLYGQFYLYPCSYESNTPSSEYMTVEIDCYLSIITPHPRLQCSDASETEIVNN